jgi:flagellar biosynthesis protein FliR
LAFDLSNPQYPSYAGQQSNGPTFHDAQVVTYTTGPFAGRQICFGAAGYSGLYILDVTNKSNMFMVGFMIAFPIIALSLLADIIFGMLMKTMPQFNLLVIGFPIKIMVAFGVLIATLTSTMLIVKGEMLEAFNALEMFF